MRSALSILILIGGVLITPSVSFAATPCEFSQVFEELNAIKESGLNSREQIVKELGLRKTILHNLSGCFIEEAQAKSEKLKGMTPATPEAKAYVRWLQNQFVETVSFYQFKSTQIQDVGLQGSKDLAKTLLERRQSIDQPLLARAVHFEAWNANQELFTVATRRLLDITATLAVFDLPTDHPLSDLLLRARESLQVAQNKNQEAWEALKLSTDDDDVLPLIKSSLEALAESYEIFFEISELGKKELPL